MASGFNDGSVAAERLHKARERHLSERVAVLEERDVETRRLLEIALAKLSKQGAELERYKGIWGGVLICASIVSVLLALFRVQLSAAVSRLFK